MRARYRCTACGALLERRDAHGCDARIVGVVVDLQARATRLCDVLERSAAAVLLSLVLAACSTSHDRRHIVVAPSDAGVSDAGIEWVSGLEYCRRIEALGCSVACFVDQVCDRARADACLDYVESINVAGTCEEQPQGLAEPICMGICVPVGGDGGRP